MWRNGAMRNPNEFMLQPGDVFSASRKHRATGALARSEGLVCLAHGSYLRTTRIPDGMPRWEIRRFVTKARAVAKLSSFPEDSVLTMEAALMMRGIETWLSVPDIEYWSGDEPRTSRRKLLPSVTVRGVVVPEVSYRARAGKRLGTDSDLIGGISVVTLEESILDLARFAHPLQAWVDVTFAMRALSGFDRWRMEEGLARVAQIKKRLLAQLEEVRGTPSFRRAHAIISKVDCGAESVGEAAVLWILNVMLRDSKDPRAHFESQMEVRAGPNIYFLDIGFPKIPFRIEFDGAGKLSETPDRPNDFLEREHRLNNMGLTALGLGIRDLRSFPGLYLKIERALGAKGIRTRPPGGPLWREVPPRLTDPQFRH